MKVTWLALESALGGHPDSSAAIDALITSSVDLQAMLGGIGAGEAGRLLADVLAAGPETRREKLAASLDIIDQHLPVGSLRKRALLSRRSVWVGQEPDADSVRAALLASLIDSALGGDPERVRSRIVAAISRWEHVVAAELNGLSKSDRDTEMLAARRVLQTVMKLLQSDTESRRAS